MILANTANNVDSAAKTLIDVSNKLIKHRNENIIFLYNMINTINNHQNEPAKYNSRNRDKKVKT